MKRGGFYLFGVLSFLVQGCGYRSTTIAQEEQMHVTVPYISGDPDAVLNNALVYQLSNTGHFVCRPSEAPFILHIRLLSDEQDRIGFRYDRDNVKGKREKNLLGVESRRSVTASVALIGRGGEEIIQPFEVSAFVDYDYTDPGSPQDLMSRPASKNAASIMQFSLGQLDSYEGASDDASSLVFRKLSEKIADQLIWKLSELK